MNGEGTAKFRGFSVNTTSIETEYAACQNVHQQYWWPLELGYTDFRIYAATGGRFDHTLANIQGLLYLKNHGAVGYLVDGTGMVLVLQNEAVHFRKELEGTMSLFALTKEAKGVNIRGMKYSLENAVITNDFPIGISNEFLGEEAEVSVEDGELVCMIRYYEDEV